MAWISLIDKDTLRIEYKPDVYVDVSEFEENMRAYKKLMRTERVFLLTIANAGSESSPEVRRIFTSKERSEFKIAEAFVISSLAQRIVANYVVRVQKPAHPLQFFSSENEASAWLSEQKAKYARRQVAE